MTPVANTLLPMILIALGLVIVVLSFLVPEKKKASIALGMGIFVVVVGIVQFGSESLTRARWNRRMSEIQRDRQKDLDELRDRMKEKPGQPAMPAAPKPAEKK